MLGVTQWRGLGIDLISLLPDIGRTQNADALRVGGHDAVLYSVVHHLDEVAGTVRPAMQVALLRGAGSFLPSGGARYLASAGSQRREQRVEVRDDLRFAADHHAVAPFQPPDSAPGPDIALLNPFPRP